MKAEPSTVSCVLAVTATRRTPTSVSVPPQPSLAVPAWRSTSDVAGRGAAIGRLHGMAAIAQDAVIAAPAFQRQGEEPAPAALPSSVSLPAVPATASMPVKLSVALPGLVTVPVPWPVKRTRTGPAAKSA